MKSTCYHYKTKPTGKLLPEKLTLIQIGALLYSEDADKHIVYSNIVDACKNNRLAYEGDIDDWQVIPFLFENFHKLSF